MNQKINDFFFKLAQSVVCLSFFSLEIILDNSGVVVLELHSCPI